MAQVSAAGEFTIRQEILFTSRLVDIVEGPTHSDFLRLAKRVRIPARGERVVVYTSFVSDPSREDLNLTLLGSQTLS